MELAIVSIVLLVLLATVADFGRLFYAQVTVENAARAGAIVAARDPSSYTGTCSAPPPSTNKIGCAIAAESRGSGVTVVASEISVTCETFGGAPTSPCPTTPQANTRSRVTVTKQFNFLMPILAAFFGSNVTMTASVASDQQSLPPAATFVPVPSGSVGPTPTPSPTPTPAPSATPTPAPTPTPTPAPCIAGYAPVPNLVVGATPGSTETVAEARTEWQTAGFASSNFTPNNGVPSKTVTAQSAPGDVGICRSVTTYAVTVTYQ